MLFIVVINRSEFHALLWGWHCSNVVVGEGSARAQARMKWAFTPSGTEALSLMTQALCWLLDELFDAEDDLLALLSRPGALVGWRRERLGKFYERMGEGLAQE